MTKSRFQPGTFLEVDDFEGARKVVMVGRDGVTCWDAVDATKVTPLVIHPVMHLAELGSLAAFVRAKGLAAAAGSVMKWLAADARQEDSLFIMRMLWSLAGRVTAGSDPDDALLRWAYQQAQTQEDAALRVHANVERYRQLVGSPAAPRQAPDTPDAA